MMARYAILQVLLRAGHDFVKIVPGDAAQAEGKGTYVALDRTKISSVGMEAVKHFLLKLQVYKSTGGVHGIMAVPLLTAARLRVWARDVRRLDCSERRNAGAARAGHQEPQAAPHVRPARH